MVYTPGAQTSAGPQVLVCGISDAGSQYITPLAVTATGRVWTRVQELANLTWVSAGNNFVGFMAQTAAALYGTTTGPTAVKPIRATTPGVGILVSENIIGTAAVLFGTHPVSGAANPLNVDAFGRLIVGSVYSVGAEAVFVKTVKLTNTGNILAPSGGTQFVLLGYIIEITGQAILAAAATLDLTFKDGLNPMSLAHSVYVPAVAFTNSFGYNTGWIDLRAGGGYLSSVSDNVLSLTFSAALTAGAVRVSIAYREL